MKSPNVIVSSDYGPIIINVNDIIIGKEICQTGYWSKDDILVIRLLVENQLKRFEKITFYDVGANIGTHTLAIAKTYADKVIVRAFEAQRQIYNMMCGTVAINNLQNAYCYNLAVSDKEGDFIEVKQPDYSSSTNFGALELMPAKCSEMGNFVLTHSEKIKTITLDSFDEKVDFIKMDIEGMEDKAIIGAAKTIETDRPVCFIEAHKSDTGFIVNYFKDRNYIGFLKSNDLIVIPIEYGLTIDFLDRTF